jgi:hypothetical protein
MPLSSTYRPSRLERDTLALGLFACAACGGIASPTDVANDAPDASAAAERVARSGPARDAGRTCDAPAEVSPKASRRPEGHETDKSLRSECSSGAEASLACASCPQSLDEACGGDCPPALGSPDFAGWCVAVESHSFAHHVGASMCEGLEIVSYGIGIDCGAAYAFDAQTGALVGVIGVRCGSLRRSCAASSTCIPPCCIDGSCLGPAPDPCPRSSRSNR